MWACAALATLNAALWAIITPPFQVIDEPAHFGYAQYLAEAGRPPRPVAGPLPPYTGEQEILLEGLPFSVDHKPSWSTADERQVRQELDEVRSPTSESAARLASTYPPLYYAYVAVPAWLGSALSPLDQLYLMRLFSATLAGITVGSVFLFLRELLPGTPWAWSVGALVVGFQPVFGYMSGGINNDAMLYAAGAVLLFLIARSFRLGLTPRRGVAIGAIAAAGVLAKTTMVGLLPGAALGLLVLWWREADDRRQAAARGAIGAGGVLGAILGTWFATDTLVFGRSLSTATGGMVSEAVGDVTSLRGQLSYLWQFFLPRLSFMNDAFPTYPDYPLWDIYVQGFVGRFGWFQYGFPLWVNQVGLAVLVLVGCLAGVELTHSREALRRRWPELCVYTTMVVGTLLLLAVTGNRFRAVANLNFEQPRYLFTLLPLYGAAAALAARGVGRRWGHVAGVVLVVAAGWHSLFAMLLTINRYYV
jgi:4-amino-4-deoxy-L-arabinose transferase-like glycosyltransferase